MGEVAMAAGGLLSKINSLFNNPLYSDIEFVFMNNDGTFEKLYCHKLILALQSKVFAYELFQENPSRSVMKMQASKKQLFYLLFKFLYTGDVQFRTFDEAQDLCELATDYQVEELVKKCHGYMMQGRLTIINIFSKYEHALKRKLDVLLKDCQNFVCSNAVAVLKADEFVNASLEVIDDIIKLNNLCLDTELDLIRAVLRWGSENLKRNEIPDSGRNLRDFINPFLKHLRVLSLSQVEFQCLVRNYDIFSAYESTIIFQKILIPESADKLPEEFCSITFKRGEAVTNDLIPFEQELCNAVKSRSTKSPQFNSSMSVQSDPPKSVQFHLSKTEQSDSNKLSYEVRKYSPKNSNASSSGLKQKFNSSPNIINIGIPPPNFSHNLLRDFLFPLKEGEKSFKLSFRKDIKCWVMMKLKSGNLALHGFELKVKKKSEKKELLEVSVYLQGFSKQRFEKSYNMELQNDVLSVKFPQPMKLQEGCTGKLEVCIEDLFLDRCCQVYKKQYELNCGLNFECVFSIDSNNKTDDSENFVFLINKLIYTPC